MPKQRLGCHQDQGFAEITPHLTPQDMEIIGRACAIRDLDIVVGAKLQISLRASGAMFWPLPLETMRQQHNQSTCAQPLRFAGSNELVDNALGAVRKVTELR